MKLFYYERELNFGDDLNRWMWERLLPGCFDNPDDGILMTVLGTTLQRNMPDSREVIVFGTGTSYAPPPTDLHSARWHIVALRGPLTARLLNLPKEKVVADAAFVLPRFKEAQPVPVSKRKGVAFLAHHGSAGHGLWPEICRRAGVDYIDIRGESFEILEKLRHYKLILAEAMHAAIVADLVRVPWIPFASNHEINTFKWMDWLQTVELPYEPVMLPQPSFSHWVRDRLVGFWGMHCLVKSADIEKVLAFNVAKMRTLSNPTLIWTFRKKVAERLYRQFIRPAAAKAEQLSLVKKWQDRRMNACATILREQAKRQGYLSKDAVVKERSDALLAKLAEVKALYKELSRG